MLKNRGLWIFLQYGSIFLNSISTKIVGIKRGCRIPNRTFLVENWKCESVKSIDFIGFLN